MQHDQIAFVNPCCAGDVYIPDLYRDDIHKQDQRQFAFYPSTTVP